MNYEYKTIAGWALFAICFASLVSLSYYGFFVVLAV